MRRPKITTVAALCSITVSAHGGLVWLQTSLQDRWARQQKEAVASIIREELEPLKADLARAHRRIDEVYAMRGAPWAFGND